MLTMVVFTTNLKEDELFLLLTSRGRQADIPYYQSVESHDRNEGIVIFCRLDCAPAQPYKVGVAGNQIITSESFASHVSSWLNEWAIEFTPEKKSVDSKEAAHALFTEMRKTTKSGRKVALQKIQEGLEFQGKAEDAALEEMIQLNSGPSYPEYLQAKLGG